jgi:hypothetical protein
MMGVGSLWETTSNTAKFAMPGATAIYAVMPVAGMVRRAMIMAIARIAAPTEELIGSKVNCKS